MAMHTGIGKWHDRGKSRFVNHGCNILRDFLKFISYVLGGILFAVVDGTSISTQTFTWELRISRSPNLNTNVPVDILPLFIPRPSALNLPTREELYLEMRQYGKLACVRVHVDVGFSERGDVLHFWDATSTNAALEGLREIPESSKARIFNPMSIICTVSLRT
jgi:hypothetical protein